MRVGDGCSRESSLESFTTQINISLGLHVPLPVSIDEGADGDRRGLSDKLGMCPERISCFMNVTLNFTLATLFLAAPSISCVEVIGKGG